MSINIQELINFKVNGLNELLTQAEKKQLLEYQKILNELHISLAAITDKIGAAVSAAPTITFTTANKKSFTRNLLAVDVDYSSRQKAIIFLHGKSNYKLWFLNRSNKVCIVANTEIVRENVYLNIIIDVKKNKYETKMSLDRFLYLVEIGDFKILNKQFIEHYLKPYNESKHIQAILSSLNLKKAEIEASISKIVETDFYRNIEAAYNAKKHSIIADYKNSTKDLCRDVEAEKSKTKRAKHKKAQCAIKHLWDSVISDQEKAYFVGWLCGHTDNIYIKVVQNGVSDKILSSSYPDYIYGNKYREKANSSGWDAASGKIRFTDISSAPIQTIKALSTSKHISRSINGEEVIFKDRTLSNLDLCLFIIGNYYEYGFKSGIKHINTSINYELLRDTYFSEYLNEFNMGFSA